MPSPSKQVFFKGYVFNVWRDVYEPAEDSFLFAENLTVEEDEKVLDVGTGCGILGIIAANKASQVVAIDINPEAVRCAKENAKLNSVADKMFFIQGDLFSPLKVGEKFDLILFNAPYLPTEPFEGKTFVERAWAGGTSGRAVIDRFLKDVHNYVNVGGRVLLLQSTFADVGETMQILEVKGFKAEIIASLGLPFFETIVLIEAKATSSP
ncbi:MAG: class I SAM-dependent methyltransferase [Candidatus Bathyarchaeia archaeon]